MRRQLGALMANLTNRKLWIVLLLVAGLGVAGFLAWFRVPLGPGVTKANCNMIHPGMTEAEVEVILGQPGKEAGWDTKSNERTMAWSGEILVFVQFDDQGRVVDEPLVTSDPTYITKVLYWLGL